MWVAYSSLDFLEGVSRPGWPGLVTGNSAPDPQCLPTGGDASIYSYLCAYIFVPYRWCVRHSNCLRIKKCLRSGLLADFLQPHGGTMSQTPFVNIPDHSPVTANTKTFTSRFWSYYPESRKTTAERYIGDWVSVVTEGQQRHR